MYQIMAHRTAGSALGPASSLLKANGEVRKFETYEQAQAEVDRLHAGLLTPNVWYEVVPA